MEAMQLKRNRWIYLGFVLLFIVGLLIPVYLRFSRVKLGDREIRCNPYARVNLRKGYQLRLWDYERPSDENQDGYRSYLEQALAVFKKQYPRVQIEIKLLDPFNGPKELQRALEKHSAPDLYCSAGEIPPFDWNSQIPVGFFLKNTERELYYPGLANLVRLYGVECYFPYWTAPSFWIGNRQLLEKAGFNPKLLQQAGWSIPEFIAAAKRPGPGRYLLVGDSGSDGFLMQLALNSMKGLESRLPGITDIGASLGIIDTLRVQKILPEEFDTHMLEYFLKGKAMVLAGANLSLYEWIKNYLSQNNPKGNLTVASEPDSSKSTPGEAAPWEPVLLPAPHQPDAAARMMVKSGVIAVYRSKFTSGDDQIALAVKLGQFLSTYRPVSANPSTGAWIGPQVCPAAIAGMEHFAVGTRLTPGEMQLIDQSLRRTPLFNLNLSPVKAREFYHVAREYYLGKINREVAVSRLRQLIHEPDALTFGNSSLPVILK